MVIAGSTLLLKTKTSSIDFLAAEKSSKMALFLLDQKVSALQKDKDGKIIICNKSKMVSGYKDKISELSSKVKKY